MAFQENRGHRFWSILVLLAIAQVLVFDLRIALGPPGLQVQYVPDDGYYYLQLAKNFSSSGQWTFDGGISTATGFHPVFAYGLAGIHVLLKPSPDQFVMAGLALGAVATLAFLLMAWFICRQHRKPLLLALLGLMISSGDLAWNTVSLTEWPLATLLALLYTVALLREAQPRRLWVLFGLGCLGSLCRSDFGLLPLSFGLASLCVYPVRRRAVLAWPAVLGWMGSMLGSATLLAHNWIVSGHLLQSSVQMKAHWGRVYGVSWLNTVGLISKMIFGISLDWNVFFLVAFLLLVLVLLELHRVIRQPGLLAGFSNEEACNSSGHDQASAPTGSKVVLSTGLFGEVHGGSEVVLLLGSLICLVGYVVLYAFNSAGLQPWHSSNLMVPVFVVLAAAVHQVEFRLRSRARGPILRLAGLLVLAIGIRNTVHLHRDLGLSPWPHQKLLLQAALDVRSQGLQGRIGAWNAGVLGYYQAGQVLNIDGLVNDDIYEYAVSNRLPEYLDRQDVRYLLDFEKMILVESRRLRGGYQDQDFLRRLKPLQVFDDGNPYEWRRLTLYSLAPARPDSTRPGPNPGVPDSGS